MENHTRRTLLGALGSAIASSALTPAVASAGHPDAELLRLALALEKAWAAQRNADAQYSTGLIPGEDADKSYEATMAVVAEIERWPAHTLEGVHVKARAVSWIYGGDKIDLVCDHDTTDKRLASSIINDLLKI